MNSTARIATVGVGIIALLGVGVIIGLLGIPYLRFNTRRAVLLVNHGIQ